MADISQFTPVKYFCGILLPPAVTLESVEKELSVRLGMVDLRSEALPFTYTDYYYRQMGSGLLRCFVAFEELRDPQELPEIKVFSNAVEDELSSRLGQGRAVNIDPGYLSEASLVLASAKPFAHRIPLSGGIYGQLEYLFTRQGVRFLPWSFPEYRSDPVVSFFLELRKVYRRQLRPRPQDR
jgi:hypothetical protein